MNYLSREIGCRFVAVQMSSSVMDRGSNARRGVIKYLILLLHGIAAEC